MSRVETGRQTAHEQLPAMRGGAARAWVPNEPLAKGGGSRLMLQTFASFHTSSECCKPCSRHLCGPNLRGHDGGGVDAGGCPQDPASCFSHNDALVAFEAAWAAGQLS